jgi:hypothetical protein
MFEFAELFSFGREFTAHGENWQSVKELQQGYCIAIKTGGTLPMQCFVVQDDAWIQRQQQKQTEG